MEKNAVIAKRKQRFGLLILIFAAIPLFAKNPPRSELENLVIKADSEIFFTASENGYTLLIPGIESSDVQTEFSTLPAGIKLVSSKKENFFSDEGERSTKIQFWFTFTDAGTAKLPPLTVKIKKRNYYLPFEEVPVYENPNLISPVLSVEFDDKTKLSKDKNGNQIFTCSVGTEIKYKVLIQYFLQIINYSWILPKDSIFRETKRYEIAESSKNQEQNPSILNKEFTPEKFSVAEYSWKPLKEGDYALPGVSIEAISYNGSRKQLSLPQILVRVTKNERKNNFDAEQEISRRNFPYNSAFTETNHENFSAEKYVPTVEDCKKLAELRSKEIHSAFWSDAAEKRREFEKSIGIISNEDEPGIIFSKIFKKKYGIFAGGEVSSVPEEKASSHNAPPAQRVKITESAAGWIYIENKNFSGWVKQDKVFVIK